MMSRTTTRGRAASSRHSDGIELVPVAYDLVDLGHGGVGLGRDLRAAAGHHDARLGPGAPRAADRLPCLALGLGGHRAGVDHHQIVEPGGLRVVAHDRRLEGIQPAAKGDDLGSAHAASASISGSRRPLKLCIAPPVIKTWSASFQAIRSDPPSSTTFAARSARPRRAAATRAAQAPLPQAVVRPAPRSQTRTRRVRGSRTSTTPMFARSGNIG